MDWRILIPIGLFVAAQTGAFIWWAASLTTSVKFQGRSLERVEEGIRLLSDVSGRLETVEKAQVDHEDRLRTLERGKG